MNKKGYIFIILFSIVLLPLVSAEGLTLITNNITVDKTVGVNKTLELQIRNDESFTFNNISFVPNNFITMSSIGSLSGGSIVTFTATLYRDDNIQSLIRIKGLYETNLGEVDPETHDVSISFSNDDYQIDSCTFTVNVGDTVRFTNNADTSLTLQNTNNQVPLANLGVGEIYERTFDSAQTFQYQFFLASFPAGPQCSITSIDSGFANNPQFDAILNITQNVNFPDTSILATAPQTSYNINVSQVAEGVMTISNTGTNIAKNVSLSAEWFSFVQNNFDLDPGETKGVIYRVSPILSSEETNQTYNRVVSIKGNFVTQNLDFSIFVPFSQEGSVIGNGTNDLFSFIEQFCNDNPTICNTEPQIQEVFINNVSEADLNLTIKNKQFQDIFREIFKISDRQNTLDNDYKTFQDAIQQYLDADESLKNNISGELSNLSNQQGSSRTITVAIFVFVLAFVIIGVAAYFYYMKSNRDVYEDTMQW